MHRTPPAHTNPGSHLQPLLISVATSEATNGHERRPPYAVEVEATAMCLHSLHTAYLPTSQE